MIVCCPLLLLHHSAELHMANLKQWRKHIMRWIDDIFPVLLLYFPHIMLFYIFFSDEKFPILSLYFPHIMLFYICFSLLLLQYWPNFCDIQEWRGLGWWWWSIECFRSAQWGNFQHYPFFFFGGGEFSIFFLRVLWIFEVSHTALISWNIPSRLTW